MSVFDYDALNMLLQEPNARLLNSSEESAHSDGQLVRGWPLVLEAEIDNATRLLKQYVSVLNAEIVLYVSGTADPDVLGGYYADGSDYAAAEEDYSIEAGGIGFEIKDGATVLFESATLEGTYAAVGGTGSPVVSAEVPTVGSLYRTVTDPMVEGKVREGVWEGGEVDWTQDTTGIKGIDSQFKFIIYQQLRQVADLETREVVESAAATITTIRNGAADEALDDPVQEDGKIKTTSSAELLNGHFETMQREVEVKDQVAREVVESAAASVETDTHTEAASALPDPTQEDGKIKTNSSTETESGLQRTVERVETVLDQLASSYRQGALRTVETDTHTEGTELADPGVITPGVIVERSNRPTESGLFATAEDTITAQPIREVKSYDSDYGIVQVIRGRHQPESQFDTDIASLSGLIVNSISFDINAFGLFDYYLVSQEPSITAPEKWKTFDSSTTLVRHQFASVDGVRKRREVTITFRTAGMQVLDVSSFGGDNVKVSTESKGRFFIVSGETIESATAWEDDTAAW